MQRPDILLVSVNSTFPYPNLGIASLSAYLKERDIQVKQAVLTLPYIEEQKSFNLLRKTHRALFREMSDLLANDRSVDPPSKKHGELEKVLVLWMQHLLRTDPHSIGFSVNIANVALSLLLARMIKKERPELPLIFGGPECNTITGSIFLNKGFADIIIEGEGEETLYQVMCGIKAGKSASIPDPVTPRERKGFYLTSATPICIDNLPPPDYQGVFKKSAPPVALPVAFNRGCSFVCSFCNEREFWKVFRQMKVANAVAFLRKLKQDYRMQRYFLTQSLMNNDIDWLKEFADQLSQSGMAVLWGGNARIHHKMDQGYFRALYEGGCRFFYWGIESAALSVLKKMQKGATPQTNLRVLRDAASSGLWNHTYWIFGFPTETESDLLASVDFILENARYIHSAMFHIYNVPGTPRTEEIPNLDIVDYYGILATRAGSERSSLVGQYPVFFSRITNLMHTRLDGPERFEADFSNPVLIEERQRMLAGLHLLRFFIVEPDERAELARLMSADAFTRAYQQIIQSQPLALEELMNPEIPFGRALFELLRKS